MHGFLHFLWAFGWSAILLFAYFGWGTFVLRLFRWPSPSFAISACVGTVVAVFVGGLLNLLRLITYDILLGFTLAGVALAVWSIISRSSSKKSLEAEALKSAWQERWPWKHAALLFFVLFFVFHSASTVFGYRLETDDENFYLAVPVKMMQTHHFAADPYSQRRIEGALGGNHFLQCLQFICLPLKYVQMSDRFVGLVLLVLLSLALARQFGLSPLLTIGVGILCVLQESEFNLSFTVLPSALWLAMILIVAREPSSSPRPAVPALLVGLLAGAMCTLKSTYPPFAVLFCAALYPLLAWGKGWRGALTVWSAALAGALIVMVPWMVAMRMTSGTYLYPVLGSGYDFSAYPQYPSPFAPNLRNIPWREIPLAGLILAQLFLLQKKGAAVVVAAAIITLVGSLASRIVTGGDDSARHVWPIMMPTVLAIYIHFAWEMRQRPAWRLGPILLACVTLFLLGDAFHVLVLRQHIVAMWHEVVSGVTDQAIDSAETRQEYASISAALPKEGLILATLQDPYLLDFSDERILIADFPGCAGLPPGWPIKDDGEALATYLQDHSIRYLAYTYVNNVQLKFCRFIEPFLAQMSVRSKIQYGDVLVADRQYLELRRTRRVLFDDGNTFIVDLATKVTPSP